MVPAYITRRGRAYHADFSGPATVLVGDTPLDVSCARAIEARVEAFNVLNDRNFSAFVANVSSSQFGQPSEALAPRRLQIGLRVDF